MPGRRTFILSAAMLAASALVAQNVFPPFADEDTSFRISARMSPVNLPAPQELNVILTLEHSGAKPLELVFPSSQDFDLTVWNNRGEQVRTWSADKIFAPVARRIEFSGKKTLNATISIADLPAGRYVVDGWLATEEGRMYRAHIPFTIAAKQ